MVNVLSIFSMSHFFSHEKFNTPIDAFCQVYFEIIQMVLENKIFKELVNDFHYLVIISEISLLN